MIKSSPSKLQWRPLISVLTRNWRLLLVLALLVAALRQSTWLPIYPDEVADRISLERYFINGGYKQSVWAVCSNFLVRPPASLVPASFVWALLDHLGIGFWSYRLVPIGCISAIVAVVAYLRRDDSPLFLLLAATLGPVLYGIAIFRSEIALLTAYVGFFLVLTLLLQTTSPWRRCLLLALVTFGFSLIALAHPKALYLFPLVFLCILVGVRGLPSLRWKILTFSTFAGAASLVAVQSAKMYLLLISSCSEVPALSSYYQHQAVNIFDSVGNRARFIEDLKSALSAIQVDKVVQHITYRGAYDIDYLPPLKVGGWEKSTNALVLTVLAATLLYTTVRLIVGLLSCRPFEDRIRYLFLGATLAIASFIFVTNLNKNFYDCALFVGSLACIAALAETVPIGWPSLPRLRAIGFTVLVVGIVAGSLLSTVLNMLDFSEKFRAGQTGPSVVNFRAQKQLAVGLSEALTRHGVPPKKSIVVDDQTYGILREHPHTLPITYLLVDNGSLLAAATRKRDAEYGAFYCTYLDALKGIADVEILERITPRAGVAPTCLVSFAKAWKP